MWFFRKKHQPPPSPPKAPKAPPLICRCCQRVLRTHEAFEHEVGFFSGLEMPPQERPDDPWRGRLKLEISLTPEEYRRLTTPGARTDLDDRRQHAREVLREIPIKAVHTRVSRALVLPCPKCGADDPLGVA